MVNDTNYADYPISIGELRSEQTEQSCDWTARDALIDVLRQIDNGLTVTTMVISYVEETEEGTNTNSRMVTPCPNSRNLILGLLARVSFLIQQGDA